MPDYFGQHGERGAWAETLRTALDTLLGAASQLPTEQMPSFLGQLETVRVVSMARLAAAAPREQEPDKLLDAGAASERLGVSVDYMYRHHDQFPFTRRVGRRLLFSSLGIDAYIKQQSVLTARRHHGTLHPVGPRRKGGTAG